MQNWASPKTALSFIFKVPAGNKSEGAVMMKKETPEDLLQRYEPLFHKVLSSCHIFRSNPDYEDYLQTIRLSFFEKSREMAGAVDEQLTLMYRFLCWRVRDYQRKQHYQQTLIEKISGYELNQTVTLEESILWEDFLERLWPKLTIGERRYLYARLYLGLPMNQIVATYQVSRSTVLNWKRKLAKRFE